MGSPRLLAVALAGVVGIRRVLPRDRHRQGLFAVLIVMRPSRHAALAGIVGNLAIVGTYFLSRTDGVPVGPHEGLAERATAIDWATTAGEIALVAVLLTMVGRHRPAPGRQRDAAGGPRALGRSGSRGTCEHRRRAGDGADPPAAAGRSPPCSRSARRPRAPRRGRCCSPSRSRIPSDSMAPTLDAGDHVLVDKLAYRASATARAATWSCSRRRARARSMLKRVVAVAGDTVGIEDGRARRQRRRPARALRGPRRDRQRLLRAGHACAASRVFVLGDNRANSGDSRAFGAVPRRDVIGRAATRLWPPARAGAIR